MHLKNVRFLIAAITTLSAYAVYVSRVNLSIAIIAMVEDHHQGIESHKLSLPTQQQLPPTNQNTSSKEDFIQPQPTDVRQDIIWNDANTQATAATTTTALNDSSPSSTNQTDADNAIKTIFLKSKRTFHLPLIRQEKFGWDAIEQGHILGAFFYGYIIFQVPGARMAESVGAKWIIMAASAGSAVISLAFPLATQLNSIHLLMALRFVLGLCQSAFFPASYVLFCRWLPESERAILLPIMFIGGTTGAISTYIVSSYLISSAYGWPSVFYLSGFICSLCSILWFVVGSNEPCNNWLITDEELSFIECNVNSQSSEINSLDGDQETVAPEAASSPEKKNQRSALTVMMDNGRHKANSEINGLKKGCCADTDEIGSTVKDLDQARRKSTQSERRLSKAEIKRTKRVIEPPLSWSKLVTSVPVWTLILSMYGNEWSHAVLCYELPTYLVALGYPIEQNGVINSFFQLTFAVASPIMSSLGAYMLDRHLFGMRKIHVRKLFQSLATFGQFICFLSVPICGENRGLIIMLMFAAVLFKACSNAGDIMVSGDLSPEYAGTIYACANSIGNSAGFGVPLLAGIVLGKSAHNRERWTPFWLITAAIMCTSGLIFLIFGETRRQDFAKSDRRGEVELGEKFLDNNKAAGVICCREDDEPLNTKL